MDKHDAVALASQHVLRRRVLSDGYYWTAEGPWPHGDGWAFAYDLAAHEGYDIEDAPLWGGSQGFVVNDDGIQEVSLLIPLLGPNFWEAE